MVDYFSTLLGISIQTVAIIIAFYAAYNVYLRQQRDKYRERLVKGLQKLDKLILRWSLLEDYGRPEWSPPTGKHMQILEEETWKNSLVNESLKDSIDELEKAFRETRAEEMKYRRLNGTLVAGVALYLKVKFALHDLISAIYREFPRPPGDYKVMADGEIPYDIKSFIRYDFPNNKKDFLNWVGRFNLYFEGIYQVYYRIRPILTKLKKIHEESAELTIKSIKDLEKMGAGWAKNSMKESVEYTMAEMNYYEQVFQHIGDMKYKIDEITGKIKTYTGYSYKGKWRTLVSIITMVVTGLVIPFLALFSNVYWFPSEVVELFAGLGFALSTIVSILLLYRGISLT